MTALDQAFIKAFSQQSASGATPFPAQVVPAAKQSPPVFSENLDGVLAALEKPPGHIADLSKVWGGSRRTEARQNQGLTISETGGQEPGARDQRFEVAADERVPNSGRVLAASQEDLIALMPVEIAGEQWAVGSEQWTVDTAQWGAGSGQWKADDQRWAVAVDGGQAAGGDTEGSGVRVDGSELRDQDSDDANTPAVQWPKQPELHPPSQLIDNPQSLIPNPQSLLEFKPAWQVERFTWPRVCRRLIGRAVDELDRLADALLTANARGEKVLAVAGCRQGEGATTLLLCAARRLAERGIKAVLVDADRTRPRLAKRLGVQPQFGWNDVSSDEGRSLDRAVVEATANNLALAPLSGPTAWHEQAADDWVHLASCIETLRKHYEMVLVDPGPLEDLGSLGDALARTPNGKIDALLLVRNQRITPEEDLNEIEQRLTAAGIAVMGLIENFVVE